MLDSAACAAALALWPRAEATGQELHLFPASGASSRSSAFLDSAPDIPAPLPAEAASPTRRCVLIQCVTIGGQPEAAPPSLFSTPVTLWTGAALLSGAIVGALGPIDYGIHKFSFTDERFFQYTTYGGGSDKASHFVVSATVTDLLYDAYRLNRLSPDQAFWLSAATMTIAGAFVEVGDGLTPYGFSAQDLTADALGAFTEALIKRNDLGDVFGFRLGRWLDTTIPPAIVGGRPLFGIDYSQEMYTADVKLGGVACRLRAPPGFERFFLVSFVFLTKGFGYEPPLASRYQEVGLEVGLNFPEILKAAGVSNETWWGDTLLRAFSFLRIPFTQVGAYYNFKNHKWYGPGAPYHYY